MKEPCVSARYKVVLKPLCTTPYILYSLKDNKLYTGYTKDLKKRLQEHKSGLNFSTKYCSPLKLIYYEASEFEMDNIAREKYLKTGPGKRFLKNRLKSFFKANLGPLQIESSSDSK